MQQNELIRILFTTVPGQRCLFPELGRRLEFGTRLSIMFPGKIVIVFIAVFVIAGFFRRIESIGRTVVD